MKTILFKYSSLIFFSILLLFFLGACSKSGSAKRKKQQNQSNIIKEEKPVMVENAESETLNLEELYKKYAPSVFLIYTKEESELVRQGTGFFVTSDGLAISNFHVFEGSLIGEEVITTADGSSYKVAEVLTANDELDYIIFRVNLKQSVKNPLPIAKEEPTIGSDVFAIGNPKGLEGTLSKGIISQFRENRRIIQTTAEITNGSSGGPLLNMKGEVVGITTGGFGEANLNLAINIQYVNLN